MPLTLSDRCAAIAPSATLEITARAQQLRGMGKPVINFGVGEPDFDTPAPVCAAARAALDMGMTRYTAAAGTPELRRAVCAKLLRDNNLAYDPADVVISAGAKQALYNVLSAVINPGDDVLLPAPYWVSYAEMVRLCGGTPVIVRGRAEEDFIVTADMLRPFVTARTKALILNSPNNPCGCVYGADVLQGIAELAVEKDFYVLSDEIYEKLIYDDAVHVSIASLGDAVKQRTIVINGVSKSCAMTGWRIGYAAGPRDVMRAAGSFQSHTTSAPNTMAQYAAVTALEMGEAHIRAMRDAFDARRKLIVALINDIPGVSCRTPKGAFYAMMNIGPLIGRDVGSPADFAAKLLNRAHVAVVPGEAFGDAQHVRLSYATDMDSIRTGIRRIAEFVQALK